MEDGKESEYVKHNLDAALKSKVDEIAEKKKQEEEEKNRFKKMTKKEKEIYKTKNTGRIDENGLKKKRKTLLEQEREIHEAYQMLLSEHNKKVRARTKKKLSAVTAFMKINSGQLKMN